MPPAFQDQQALQQLLSGMNTMQMQAGLMPGGIPAYGAQNAYQAPPIMTPAQFSNSLSVNLRNTFAMNPVAPPGYGGVTPVARNDWASNILPGPQLGSGFGMARQRAISSENSYLTGGQTAAGFGARGVFGAVAMGIGTAATGNPWAGAAIGAGADYLFGNTVGKMAELPFNQFIDQRKRAIQLQNMSMNNVRTGSDLSASGMGLGMNASMNLERNLMNISDNRNFKRDTGNMFNRQDMMKITQISSQVGLLDNAQSVDQMSREMGKIGRALATFMRVVEEPDVQQALQMMGKMRTMGMNVPEMNVAATNARAFARMAGTTVQGVMQAGVQGAGTFQQFGLSAATGFNAGMAATGTAGVMATRLDPRQLSMLGGREGLSQNIVTGAAKMANIDALLPGLATMGKGGELGIDQNAVMNLLSGKQDIGGLIRESSRKLSGMGPKGFMEAYSTQQKRLKDKFMSSLGGQAGTLLPLVIAKNIMDTGATDNIGAALRIAGFSEDEARTFELQAKDPEFFSNLRKGFEPDQQINRSNRVRERGIQQVMARSEGVRRVGRGILDTATTVGSYIGAGMAAAGGANVGAVTPLKSQDIAMAFNYAGNAVGNFMQDTFGTDVDIAEQRAAGGGGPILQAVRQSKFGSAEQTKQTQALMRTKGALSPTVLANMREIAGRVERATAGEATGYSNPLTPSFMAGPEAMSFGPRSEYRRDTLLRGQGFFTQAESYLGRMRTTTAKAEAEFTEAEQTGALIGEGRSGRLDTAKAQALTQRYTQGGMKAEKVDAALAAASAGINEYTEGLSTAGYQTGDFKRDAMINSMRNKLKARGYNDKDVNAFMNDKDFIKQALAVGEGGRSESTRNILNTVESTGADLVASRTRLGARLTREVTDKIKEGALTKLGIGGSDSTYADKAALAGVFSDTGEGAGLKKKLLAIKALRAAAGGKGSERADVMEAELTRTTKAEDLKAAAASIEETSESIDSDTLINMGRTLSKNKGTETELMDAVSADFQKARAGEIDQGIVKLVGSEGAKQFRKGKTSEESMANLRKHVKNGGQLGNLNAKNKARLLSGDMTADEFSSIAAGEVSGKSEAAVSGGHTQRASTEGGLDAQTETIVSTLEDWSKQYQERADKSFSKLDTAADKLKEAAETMGASKDEAGIFDSLAKAIN